MSKNATKNRQAAFLDYSVSIKRDGSILISPCFFTSAAGVKKYFDAPAPKSAGIKGQMLFLNFDEHLTCSNRNNHALQSSLLVEVSQPKIPEDFATKLGECEMKQHQVELFNKTVFQNEIIYQTTVGNSRALKDQIDHFCRGMYFKNEYMVALFGHPHVRLIHRFTFMIEAENTLTQKDLLPSMKKKEMLLWVRILFKFLTIDKVNKDPEIKN